MQRSKSLETSEEGGELTFIGKKKNSAAKLRHCRRKDEVCVRGELGAGRTIGYPGGFLETH